MISNMKKELCINAHVKHHAVQSMSDDCKCYNNDNMESFFATLKKLYRMNTMQMPDALIAADSVITKNV